MRFESARLCARELDHLGPLLSFLGNELAEVGRRAGKEFAQLGKLRFHFGIRKSRIDLGIEPIDDFGRRAPGRANPEKCAGFEASQKIAHRWKVW